MDQNDVAVAFDIVLEEIENAIAGLNKQGAQAFQAGKYEIAKDLTEKGSQMTAFRGKVSDLRKEWLNIFGPVIAKRDTARRKKRSGQAAERLKRGLRTPEENFRIPILQALVDLGGSAPVDQVLDKVEEKMRTQLNVYDRQPLPSDPNQTRWRNTAQWARNGMLREGLLAADSPRGVWQITQAGREWLAEASKARPA